MKHGMSDKLAAFLAEHDEFLTEHAEHYPGSLPHNAVRFESIPDLKRKVTASGSHFWDRETVRFFGSKTVALYQGRVLVTSEEAPYEGTHYAVRYFHTDGGRLEHETPISWVRDREEAKRLGRQLAALIVGNAVDIAAERH